MNTEPKPIYGDGNPETHPLTWRLSKQEAVHSADDYEAAMRSKISSPRLNPTLISPVLTSTA